MPENHAKAMTIVRWECFTAILKFISIVSISILSYLSHGNQVMTVLRWEHFTALMKFIPILSISILSYARKSCESDDSSKTGMFYSNDKIYLSCFMPGNHAMTIVRWECFMSLIKFISMLSISSA